MSLSVDQRRLLGAFLRTHRERAIAGAAGPHGGTRRRRRTPGLRREEIAQLCGISPTWYSWIEQGRDISVSAAVLSRLAEVLRLTAAERAYLFELAHRRDPADKDDGPDRAADPARVLQPALDAVGAPAYLLDRLWRARAWNAPAARLFSDWLGGSEPSLLGYVFLDHRARSFIPDWENRARRLAAEFRADTGRHSDDALLRAEIERLRAASPSFAAFWTDHAVLAREGGIRRFARPGEATLCFEQITLNPSAWPDHKLVMLIAASEEG